MSSTRIITKADAEASRAEANRVWDVYIALRATIKDAAEAAAKKEELSASYDKAVAARDKAREVESMVGQSILVPSVPAPVPQPAPAPAAIKAPAPKKPPEMPAQKPVSTPTSSSGHATGAGGSVTVTGGSVVDDDDSFEDDLVEPPAK